MAALLSLMPIMAAADFADFVGNAKDAAKKTFASAPPPPPVVKSQLSFREHMATFWQRNSPSDFIFEGLMLLFLAFYVFLHFIGKAKNEKIAKESFQKIYRQLNDNFALVGLQPNTAPLAKEGNDHFVSYVSGRKNVSYSHITIRTAPRHDRVLYFPIMSLYGLYFEGESMSDRLTIKFTLPASFDGFVFGILSKDVMRLQRLNNWDLTFTKTNDASFSNSFVIMSEVAEVNEKILTTELTQIVTDMTDSLEYIVISDQPQAQPKTAEQPKSVRTLRLSVLLGSRSATAENLNMLLACLLETIDNLPKQGGNFSNNSQKKLALAREETYRAIAKQLAQEEAEDAPRRPTRKELREKERKEAIGKLSAKEQKRALEKERERALKRGQSKMSKRG